MDVSSIVDFANEATADVAKYEVRNVFLNSEYLRKNEYPVGTLIWDSISYGTTEIDKVPNDKRGVYAFAICHPSDVLPPHGYVLYIGIAGRDSNRALRARYRDYLNEKKILKRERIARMIGTWHEVLRFYFAPVESDVSSSDLQLLEQKLNAALMPPCSEGDLEANTKRKRRAFK